MRVAMKKRSRVSCPFSGGWGGVFDAPEEASANAPETAEYTLSPSHPDMF